MSASAPILRDKRMTADEAVGELRDGMTIGIGGWGSRRKPMALVRAILRSSVTDLTLVSFGGPDVGLLCSAGRIRELVFGFVSLDSIPYDPWFGRVRRAGAINVRELDEGMVVAGLRAAAQRLPFVPIRAGLGSDVLINDPSLRTVRSPYEDAEELVAMPALNLDAAFVHLNRADPHGNAAYLGPDPYFDDLFCLAAQRRFVSCERVLSTAELTTQAPPQALLLNRMMVDGVVEAPGGAHFTSCVPDYDRDESLQREYAAAAEDDDAWASFAARFLNGSEDDYQVAVRAEAKT
jgi:glutaconate CoA-transferase subunit A